MKTDNLPGLDQFLRDYPGMSIAPSRGPATVVKGTFSFTAGTNGSPKISDSYELRIEIPGDFPRDLPKVTETGSKIPRDGDHHVNLDGTICMGSPLRLLVMLSKKPDLVGFAEICLVPYLYGISDNLLNKSALPFGEVTAPNE
ncbi:MAG: hypothetical protein M1587_11720 [Thaumarchaeota archaeon]|nr:hypothetical protein [Nitrososphaerota archaeon]